MKTVKINGEDVPLIEPEVITTIKNKKTGEIYKDEEAAKNVPAEDIQKDVLVKMPSLDLFGKTK